MEPHADSVLLLKEGKYGLGVPAGNGRHPSIAQTPPRVPPRSQYSLVSLCCLVNGQDHGHGHLCLLDLQSLVVLFLIITPPLSPLNMRFHELSENMQLNWRQNRISAQIAARCFSLLEESFFDWGVGPPQQGATNPNFPRLPVQDSLLSTFAAALPLKAPISLHSISGNLILASSRPNK